MLVAYHAAVPRNILLFQFTGKTDELLIFAQGTGIAILQVCT